MAFLAPLALAGAAAGGSSLLGAGLGTALAVGSGIFTGVNAIQQGHYQAAVARNNAIIAEQNANRESEVSQREAMRSDWDYAAQRGEVLAAQGASGLDILGRTQLRTRDTTRRAGRMAAGDIRSAGTAVARRLMQDAANFRAEGKAAKRQGWVSGIGSFMDAASSLNNGLGGSSSLIGERRARSGGRRPWNQGRG